MEEPKKTGAAAPYPNTATPPVIIANRYAFAKALRTPVHNAFSGAQLPPVQPCTWLQLAMIFCFTGSGNTTKSSSAAI